MEKKKYTVYYNDGVNEPADVFTADTLDECKAYINDSLQDKTPVNEDYPCTDDVMNSSRTFIYEVYNRPMVEAIDGEDILNEPVFTSDYYYTD